jgi:hypothetical protein
LQALQLDAEASCVGESARLESNPGNFFAVIVAGMTVLKPLVVQIEPFASHKQQLNSA